MLLTVNTSVAKRENVVKKERSVSASQFNFKKKEK